jgi:D-alanyl-lipoteichoic acid acyltransferase DltB (MBOAT superfamily)
VRFTQGTYFAFLVAVFFVYWTVAAEPKLRVIALLAASYIFYAPAGVVGLTLLFLMSTMHYAAARFMTSNQNVLRRKLLLLFSLLAAGGSLCVFKYANFILESALQSLSFIGIEGTPSSVDIVAPLGISFFTLQSTGYVIQVYRKDVVATASYVDFLAFVSFFPTVASGPILRGGQLLDKLRQRVTLDAEQGGMALVLIAVGLTKKIVIADYLGVNLVDRVFDFPERFSSLEILAAVYGYAVQIYCDFSGYSDIAIGSAMLLGFKLPDNFNSPYRSGDLVEFWRRWHISLSLWLRDFIFASITRFRPRAAATPYLAALITMLIGGLWHGPTWSFVLWGLLHGIGLIVVQGLTAVRRRRRKPTSLPARRKWLGLLLTLNFVCFTWIFFRADTATAAFGLIRQLFGFTADLSNLPFFALALICLCIAAHYLPEWAFGAMVKSFCRLPAPAQAAVLVGMGIGLYFLASSDVAPFIYSRF